MDKILEEFKSEMIGLYGVYKVASVGLLEVHKNYNTALAFNPNLEHFIIRDTDNEYDICQSAKDFERCISKEGSFILMLSGVFLSLIYQLWKDKFRTSIAKYIKADKSDITSDLFGEIRKVRNAIVHNNFKPTSELKTLKLLSFIRIDDEIKISRKEMSRLVSLLEAEIDEMKVKYRQEKPLANPDL